MAMMAIAPAHPLDHVPCTWHEAMASPNCAQWAEAINKETAAMRCLGVREVVLKIPSYLLIGTIWVFRHKYNADGNPVKLKA